MFRYRYQAGFLNLFYSVGSKPLSIWKQRVENGYIKRITDPDIRSVALEIVSLNVINTYITCPPGPKEELAIKLPFLVVVIKYLKKYFSFEIQILDDMNMRRRFRASNYMNETTVKPCVCSLPMRLNAGWNQIQFNLSDFTRRAYGTNYIEAVRVTIFANCRVRRIYFSDRLYTDEDMPEEYRLMPAKQDVED